MKNIRYPLVFVALVLFLTSCGDKPAEQKSEPTQKVIQTKPVDPAKLTCALTVGWDPWEPYQYLTPDNQVRGLEIDLISSIAKEASCTITFIQNDWMRLLKGIRNGSIDMLGGASKTASREEFAYFSTPYRHESFVLYIRAEQKNEFAGKTLKQLLENKFKLGVTEDYIYGDEVSGFQDNPIIASQIIGVPITEMNYFNLIQHQVDGFLEDPFVAAYTIKRKGLAEQIIATTVGYDSGNVSFMFSKKSVSTEIVDAFNQGLKTIKASGEYDKILKKYSH